MYYDVDDFTMPKQSISRKCLYCDVMVRGAHVVCNKHFNDFMRDKDQEWVKFLIKDDSRMARQDHEDFIAQEIGVDHLPERNRMLTKEEIDEIQRLHKHAGLGYVRIARELDLNPETVKYYTSAKSKKHKSRFGHERGQEVDSSNLVDAND